MLPALWFRVQPSNWFHGPRPVSKSVAMWWPKESELGGGALRATEQGFLQSDGPVSRETVAAPPRLKDSEVKV
jgi:hypothetical protein